jgi:isopenicillin-N N-acyltransferase like protein
MDVTKRSCVLASVIVLSLTFSTLAAEGFRFPESTYGKGQLRYHGSVPIVTLEGSPAEIGEQMGVLVLKPASELLTKKVDDLLEAHGLGKVFPLLMKTGNVMTPQFPADHLAELESMAKHSGWPRDLLVLANTIPDLRKLTSCSALIVSADKSSTGSPLFGRNLDTPPFLPLHEYTFVAVYRPKGKRAFAVVAYPGTIGCYSGMNDAGLALADLTVNESSDGSLSLNPFGVPYTLAMRRVLEECGTVDETEKLIRSLTRTTMQNLAVCDPKAGLVLEITTKTVVRRQGEDGICPCTNYFRTRELSGPEPQACERYNRLEKSRIAGRLGVGDVIKQLDSVHQGRATLQSMVFEPGVLRLHLAIGEGPASSRPFREIDLKPLLAVRPTQK